MTRWLATTCATMMCVAGMGLTVDTAGAAGEGSGEQRIELPGNPSTGYRWRFDPAASAGADHVSVEEVGYQPPENPMPGAPAVFAFTVRCLSSGDARLAFLYLRPWENAPVETREVELRCP